MEDTLCNTLDIFSVVISSSLKCDEAVMNIFAIGNACVSHDELNDRLNGIYFNFYVVFIVLSCDYFVRNDEINEHIYIYI